MSETNTITQKTNTVAAEREQNVATVRPRYRVETSDDAYAVSVDLPGVTREKVEITVEDGVLAISARRENALPEGWRPLSGSANRAIDYQLKLDVADEIAIEGIVARVANGVLNLTLPKAPERKPRRISIE